MMPKSQVELLLLMYMLTRSGLVPKYSKKKDYGKPPAYLTKLKEQDAANKAAYEQYMAASTQNQSLFQVSDQER